MQRQHLEQHAEPGCIERHHARVAGRVPPEHRVGMAVFNNLEQPPVIDAQPSVACRIVWADPQDRHGGILSLACLDQPLQRGVGQERRVAEHHQHRADLGQSGAGGHQGMPGAELRLLQHHDRYQP
jgi:hypothetical protein